MADQDAKTGAVDPRPEEMNTGAKTGQASGTATPLTDAAGKDLAAVSGSAPAQSPGSGNSPATPSQSPSATDTQSSDDAASAKTDIRASVDALVAKHADDNKEGRAAIIDANAAVKSVVNTSAMVEKAETQSPPMQTGAQVAHDNAFQSLVKKFENLAVTLGEDIAKKVAKELGKLHGLEDVVKNALKQAGVID